MTVWRVGAAASIAVSLAGSAAFAQPAGASRVTACTLLTKDEIKKLLGPRTSKVIDLVPPNEEILKSGGSECFVGNVTIQLDAYPVSSFDATKKRYAESGTTAFRELPGVGDAAFSYDQNPGKTSHVVGIFTRTGPHVLTISMDVNTGDSVEALREDALVLTKAAIVKLK